MRPRWIIPVGVLTTVTTLLGCATASPDLMRTGYLRLENSSGDRRVRALWFSVREQNQGLVVSGMLKQKLRCPRSVKAHVDITIRAPDGTILAERRLQDLYVPRNRIGAGSRRFKRFSARFDSIPPPNSAIQIVAHRGTHQ